MNEGSKDREEFSYNLAPVRGGPGTELNSNLTTEAGVSAPTLHPTWAREEQHDL
jgi:hypothetical protein